MIKNEKKKVEKNLPYLGDEANFYKPKDDYDIKDELEIEETKYNKDIKQITMIKQKGWKYRHKEDADILPLWQKILILVKFPIIILLISLFVFKVILLNGIVPSSSMETNIMTGDWILSNRLAYKDNAPQRGDVIVFWSEENESLLVKRVIGVPGDTVELYNGSTYINGCKLIEKAYAIGETDALKVNRNTFNVPENCVFVMGDNRENSIDSRYWENSYVNFEDIKGKVLCKYSLFSDNGTYIKKIPSIQPIITSEYFNVNLNDYNLEKKD